MTIAQKHLFILNPNNTIDDVKEAIHDVLSKTKAVLTCIMFATEFAKEEVELDSQTLFDALCVVDNFLHELAQLYQRLEK